MDFSGICLGKGIQIICVRDHSIVSAMFVELTCTGEFLENPGQIMEVTIAYLNRFTSYNDITKIGCKWL